MPGVQVVIVDAHDLATGIYLIKLQSGTEFKSVKVVNIR